MTVDLNFLAKQQEQILVQLAEMRLSLDGGLAGLRDDVTVLTAITTRIENSQRRQHELTHHVLNRVRKLEEQER